MTTPKPPSSKVGFYTYALYVLCVIGIVSLIFIIAFIIKKRKQNRDIANDAKQQTTSSQDVVESKSPKSKNESLKSNKNHFNGTTMNSKNPNDAISFKSSLADNLTFGKEINTWTQIDHTVEKDILLMTTSTKKDGKPLLVATTASRKAMQIEVDCSFLEVKNTIVSVTNVQQKETLFSRTLIKLIPTKNYQTKIKVVPTIKTTTNIGKTEV